MTLYDAENSLGLDNGQSFPSLGSRDKPQVNGDGSVDLYFGAKTPEGKDSNWLATVPGPPNAAIRKRIRTELRRMWNASSLQTAQEELDRLVAAYRGTADRLADWLEHNVREGFAVFTLPEPHWRRLRTANPIERAIQQEIKRRTSKVRVFPNRDALVRLATAVLVEIDEDGATSDRINWHSPEPDHPNSESPDFRLLNLSLFSSSTADLLRRPPEVCTVARQAMQDAASLRALLERANLGRFRLQHWEAEAPNAIMGWTVFQPRREQWTRQRYQLTPPESLRSRPQLQNGAQNDS